METRKLDGYAVQNTKHVLCALAVYDTKSKTSTPREAEKAAIETYHNLCGKRICSRSVRNWLSVVKSYGGATKTPENAFGALRSCRHAKRPILGKLRQIAGELTRITTVLGKVSPCDARTVLQIQAIDRHASEVFSRVQNDQTLCHLLSIQRLCRQLASTSQTRLHAFISAADLETALGEVRDRLKAVLPRDAKGA